MRSQQTEKEPLGMVWKHSITDIPNYAPFYLKPAYFICKKFLRRLYFCEISIKMNVAIDEGSCRNEICTLDKS